MTISNYAMTFLFKDIFENYDDFSAYVDEYCPDLKNVARLSKIYDLLNKRFQNSNIRYDTPEAFKRQFALTLEQFAEKFEFDYGYLSNLYKLTEEDIMLVNEAYNANAETPNMEYEDSLKAMWEYISAQTGSRLTRNKMESIIEALDKVGDRRFNLFLDKFQRHFMRIFAPAGYYYNRNGDDDND